MERDFSEYHKTIYAEMQALKNRVRFLIGDTHWQSDGEHKEAIVRHVLNKHLPERFRVGQGFVVFREGNSTQIDVLVTDKEHPTLFKEDSLQIVSPDAVRCILEIKTKINSRGTMLETLETLSNNKEKIRQEQGRLHKCDAALFVFEDSGVKDEVVLECLQEAAKNNECRSVNLVSIGSKCFIRYWRENEREDVHGNEPCWVAYDLDDLAPTYLISNIVVDMNWQAVFGFESYWFPTRGGKDIYRTSTMPLTKTN